MRTTVEFLNTRQLHSVDGVLEIRELPIHPETYVPNVAHIIQQARTIGGASDRIEEHMLIECVDFERASEVGPRDVLNQLQSYILPRLQHWREAGDFVSEWWSQDKYMFIRNYAPFSVFPLPYDVRVRLMTGGILIRCFMNVSAVLRYIGTRGWRVLAGPDTLARQRSTRDPSLAAFATLEKDGAKLQLPPALVGRLTAEFLRPRTLVAALDAIVEGSSPGSRTGWMVNFRGEDALWD